MNVFGSTLMERGFIQELFIFVLCELTICLLGTVFYLDIYPSLVSILQSLGGIFTLTWARVRVFWLYVVTIFLERQAIHMASQNVTPFFRFVEKQPV